MAVRCRTGSESALSERLAGAQAHALEMDSSDPENTTVKGVVAALHCARHGQANGVMLATGNSSTRAPTA